jgi:far upstream element-binding protein
VIIHESIIVPDVILCISGGETIREINRQSGAHCELSRDPPPNPHERVFRIQGSPDQIQTAIRLINEKTGQVCV